MCGYGWYPRFGANWWHLVTHFVGCRPYQLAMTPEVEECFTQMEQAFNFVDNQVFDKLVTIQTRKPDIGVSNTECMQISTPI